MSVVELICQARDCYSGREMTQSNSRSATTIVPGRLRRPPRRASHARAASRAPSSRRAGRADTPSRARLIEENGAASRPSASAAAAGKVGGAVIREAHCLVKSSWYRRRPHPGSRQSARQGRDPASRYAARNWFRHIVSHRATLCSW
jgi:hypothetical protein